MSEQELRELEKTNFPAYAREMVLREVDEFKAADAAVAARLEKSRLGRGGPSLVLSVRLDEAQHRALELRAAAIGVQPSKLARNLICVGLREPNGLAVSRALDRLEVAITELRGLVA
jgi:hypothetical protein